MMKTTNAILRLCATLCLIAGFAALGAGCGDDNNGSSGDDCPSGQVSAEIGGEAQCYEVCETDGDCSGGGTCQSTANSDTSVCVGGSGGGNNGADAGNNGTDGGGGGGGGGGADGGGGGLECGDGEVAVDPIGRGEACYATCSAEGDCTAPEECQELNDGSSICFEPPTGQATCSEILSCQSGCAQDDTSCQAECFYEGTADAQATNEAMNQCFADNCSDAGQDQIASCIQTNCADEMNACADCQSGDVDLTRGFGITCVTECTEGGGECTGGESCQSPILIDTPDSYCAHDMSALADACAGHGDCPTPDAPGGQPFCVPESQEPTFVNGFCYAAGCQLRPDNSQSYGLSTGCGLDAICTPQADGMGGTVGFCLPLCSTVEDCRDTDLDAYTCTVVQKTGDTKIGICNAACSSDADCQGQDGNAGGRCNSLSYCEFPCAGDGTCAQGGGTCDADDFCVFEDAATQ